MSSEAKKPNWATAKGLPAAVTLVSILTYLYRALPEGGGIAQDFAVYYAAAMAVANGLNPYDMEVLSNMLPRNSLPFVYPLVTAYVFRPFLIVPYEAAAIIYVLMKSLCLIYLVRIWVEYFLPPVKSLEDFLLQVAIFAFGLSLTIHCDLAGGNVSIIEQTFLWTGFVFFLRGRLLAFCACVVLAASFKFTLSLALLLLFTTGNRWRSAMMYCSFAVLSLVPALSYAIAPDYFGEYLALLTMQGAMQRGFTNPSLLSALIDFPFVKSIPYASLVAYVAIAITVVFFTVRAMRNTTSRTEIVLIFTVAYALTVPRISPYSYIVLLPAISHLFMAWRIELPKWALPTAAIGLPIILSAHSIGTFFNPWINWLENFHHVVLSAACFMWWVKQRQLAYSSFKVTTPKAAIESSAATV